MPAFLDDEAKYSGPLPRGPGAGGESLHSLVSPMIASRAADLNQRVLSRWLHWSFHSLAGALVASYRPSRFRGPLLTLGCIPTQGQTPALARDSCFELLIMRSEFCRVE